VDHWHHGDQAQADAYFAEGKKVFEESKEFGFSGRHVMRRFIVNRYNLIVYRQVFLSLIDMVIIRCRPARAGAVGSERYP
jgi:hypothetical protein